LTVAAFDIDDGLAFGGTFFVATPHDIGQCIFSGTEAQGLSVRYKHTAACFISGLMKIEVVHSVTNKSAASTPTLMMRL